jgi:hypothetical protein
MWLEFPSKYPRVSNKRKKVLAEERKKNTFGVLLNLNHLKNSLRCLLNAESSLAPSIWKRQSDSSDELEPNFNVLHMW